MPVEGSNFVLEVDAMIDALGTSPNPLLRMTTPGLEADKHGCLIADEKGKTTHEGVFAGGDAVTGAATVILAMGAGKTAATAIDSTSRTRTPEFLHKRHRKSGSELPSRIFLWTFRRESAIFNVQITQKEWGVLRQNKGWRTEYFSMI